MRADWPVVARFLPIDGDVDAPSPLPFQDDPSNPWSMTAFRLWRARALGPALEIYEVRPVARSATPGASEGRRDPESPR